MEQLDDLEGNKQIQGIGIQEVEFQETLPKIKVIMMVIKTSIYYMSLHSSSKGI